MEVKPYYSYKDILKLYVGNAIEIMKNIPDETIDIIV